MGRWCLCISAWESEQEHVWEPTLIENRARLNPGVTNTALLTVVSPVRQSRYKLTDTAWFISMCYAHYTHLWSRCFFTSSLYNDAVCLWLRKQAWLSGSWSLPRFGKQWSRRWYHRFHPLSSSGKEPRCLPCQQRSQSLYLSVSGW